MLDPKRQRLGKSHRGFGVRTAECAGHGLASAERDQGVRLFEITGWPELTMVRGQCIVSDGELVGAKGFGEFIKREVRAHASTMPSG